MINWKAIGELISEATQIRFSPTQASPISGGYTNQAWHLEGSTAPGYKENKSHYFVKLDSADKAEMFAAEYAGLAALSATHTVRVPRVICCGVADQHAFLVLEYFELFCNGNCQLLGSQLASLHRVQALQFGWLQDNTLSLTPQHNT